MTKKAFAELTKEELIAELEKCRCAVSRLNRNEQANASKVKDLCADIADLRDVIEVQKDEIRRLYSDKHRANKQSGHMAAMLCTAADVHITWCVLVKRLLDAAYMPEEETEDEQSRS
jgi:hypothetical protein